MSRINILAALLIMLLPPLVRAQNTQAKSEDTSSAVARGKEMFQSYCASCHGATGKGNGPAAKALKTPPPDLTKLAARNKGQFPEMKVLGAINAGPGVPAHGTAEMPVWGPAFVEVTQAATEAEVQLKIYNLTEFVKTLQAK